jgi:hypothetical protein
MTIRFLHGQTRKKRALPQSLTRDTATLFPRIRTSPATRLSEFCAQIASSADGSRLKTWLDTRPHWTGLTLGQLDEWLDMVDRLTFTPPQLTSDPP